MSKASPGLSWPLPDLHDDGDRMPSLADHLFAEVDRQLVEQRAHADALATRAGLLVAAATVAASLLARRIQGPRAVSIGALATLGIAAVFGVLVLCMSRLAHGARLDQLGAWGTITARSGQITALREMYGTKLKAVGSNDRQLLITEVFLYLQAGVTVVAVGWALYAVWR